MSQQFAFKPGCSPAYKFLQWPLPTSTLLQPLPVRPLQLLPDRLFSKPSLSWHIIPILSPSYSYHVPSFLFCPTFLVDSAETATGHGAAQGAGSCADPDAVSPVRAEPLREAVAARPECSMENVTVRLAGHNQPCGTESSFETGCPCSWSAPLFHTPALPAGEIKTPSSHHCKPVP